MINYSSNRLQQPAYYGVLPFRNPICKETFESLPRIYQNYQYNNKKVHSSKNLRPDLEEYHKDIYHLPKIQAQSGSSKGISRYLFPGKTKIRNAGSKAKIRNATQGDVRVLFDERKSNSIYKKYNPENLEVKRFDLKDLQTQHKVQGAGENNLIPRQITQLEKLLSKYKNGDIKNINQIREQTQAAYANQQLTVSQKKANKSSIQEQNREYKSQLNANKKQRLPKAYSLKPNSFLRDVNQPTQVRDRMRSYDSYDNENKKYRPVYQIPLSKQSENQQKSRSERSVLSLSRHIFSEKKSPTMFGNLEAMMKNGSNLNSSRKTKVQSKNSEISIKIPEEHEYKAFITKYKPMSENFDVSSLIKSQKFKIIRDQRSVYFGEANENDEKEGYGILINEKEIFEGQFANGIKRLGYERNIDGLYIGGFKNGFRYGQGSFKWNNGEVFLGHWKNGMKNGFGKWKSPQGYFYQGEWYQNRQQGIGLFKHAHSIYRGQFKNFLKQGHGQEIFTNGDKYVGQYKQGKPSGKGRYQWKQGGYYQGHFREGKRNGFGVWYDNSGNFYEGQFENDEKDGRGKQIYKTGQRFEGIFKKGQKIKGKLYNNSNEEIQILIK